MKTVAVETRPARPDDAHALAAVHAAAWQDAYRGLIPHNSLAAMIERRDPAWWRRTIETGAGVTVLDFGGVTVGYATAGRNRTPRLKAGGEIYELYLKPEYQGVGLGKRLFLATCRRLHAAGRFGLVVWAIEDNARARAFYEHLGGADIAQGHERFDGRILDKIAYLWP